ncbi:TetR/AcrR family transcriptional regulator [Streptomyces sp. A1136]|uniref:TetR/AcrR family transcriptional regulator n=1 Tax=Streptomyces sp. A1136 TaxID=2563102 RepID=UPI00109EA1D1|nr:TetR/AcrR family transcriptional regulator [Streptomyces sp. A1136]THA57182.1 TetR/AcrR family transcriptional regulator [Streptomyces sp. A1136]
MTGTRWSEPPLGRRRGPELERAILDAALEQLSTVGWNALTMEGVATAARTGKAALYRRWPSKAALVAEVLRAGLPPLDRIPDTGSIRDDLFGLCARMCEVMRSRAGVALRAVLHECDHDHADRFRGVIWNGLHEPAQAVIRTLVRRGIERGEVRPDADTPFLVDVIPAMLMYRAKMYGSEWDDQDIAQLVDGVMVPMLRA